MQERWTVHAAVIDQHSTDQHSADQHSIDQHSTDQHSMEVVIHLRRGLRSSCLIHQERWAVPTASAVPAIQLKLDSIGRQHLIGQDPIGRGDSEVKVPTHFWKYLQPLCVFR